MGTGHATGPRHPFLRGVYRLQCTVTGDCYVGRSKDIAKRWSAHKSKLRKGTHYARLLQRDWSLYGESAFVLEMLEITDSGFERYKGEKKWITILKPAYNTHWSGLHEPIQHIASSEIPPHEPASDKVPHQAEEPNRTDCGQQPGIHTKRTGHVQRKPKARTQTLAFDFTSEHPAP